MSLQKIRLELARTKEEPTGNADCGYEFVAPLDPSGHFDEGAWRNDLVEAAIAELQEEYPDLDLVGEGWEAAEVEITPNGE